MVKCFLKWLDVRCGFCGHLIGKADKGSTVQIKCRHCGTINTKSV